MTFTKSKMFVFFCVAFLAGVAVASFFVYPKMDWEFWILIGLTIMFCAVGLFTPSQKILRILMLSLSFFLLGILLFGFAQQKFVGGVTQLVGKNLEMTGQIVSEPDFRDAKTKLAIGNLKAGNIKVDGLLLLEVRRYPEYKFGQVVRFVGKVEEPPVFDDFSYKDYLKKEGISAVVRFPESVQVVGEAHDLWTELQKILLKVKFRFMKTLFSLIPEPFAAFLGGILVGAKKNIDERLALAFALTGTAHIVAISGYNISIFTSILGRLIRHLASPKLTFIILLILVTAFVMITGAQSSTIRAAIMGMLTLTALFFSRHSIALRLLIFASALMVAINPLILRYDVGFQLSVTACAGLVLLSPRIRRKRMIQKLGKFGEALADTLAAIVFTLPLLLFYFERLTLSAPLVNMIILPFLPISMFFGFITGILGLFWFKAGMFVAVFTSYLLAFIVNVIEVFAALPFASVEMKIPPALVVFYYALLAFFCYRYSSREVKRFYIDIHHNHSCVV